MWCSILGGKLVSTSTEAWLERAKSFKQVTVGFGMAGFASGEAAAFAISMASTFYGANSKQVETIRQTLDALSRTKPDSRPQQRMYEFAAGAIQNMVAEIKAGLVESLRLRIAGEVLADLVSLSREALDDKAVQVGAVLAAAAFEDLMRRLGEEKAGITSRIKLDQVLIELKNKCVLEGGEPGVAQSFLKFRNDSLHADWQNVTETQVQACLSLVDSLMIKHLG